METFLEQLLCFYGYNKEEVLSFKSENHSNDDVCHIDFSKFKDITYEQLIWSIKGYPNLESVNLGGCKNLFTEESTESTQVAETFPNLTNIELADCVNLTDESIKKIVKSFPNLTSINFAGTKYFSPELSTFLASYPDLKVNCSDPRYPLKRTDAGSVTYADIYGTPSGSAQPLDRKGSGGSQPTR
jgi:hypothetical protein